MALSQDALTFATETFRSSFIGIQADFLGYGQSIFFILLTITIVWKGLEYGWSKDITESMPSFIRELIGAMFFYSVMMNVVWLTSLPKSAMVIGQKYIVNLDPSSIIVQGVVMCNTLMTPLIKAGLWDAGASLIVGLIACGAIMFCLINIAINVAVTTVITQALISVSPLFLAAGALKQSSQIARNLIDSIIGNTVKLIGYFLVIYAGTKAITTMSAQIDGTFDPATSSIDQFSYIVSVVGLYYGVAKTLPDQFAKLVTGVLQENRGIDAVAAAMSAMRIASNVMPAAKVATTAVSAVSGAVGKTAGSTMANALANYKSISSSQATGGSSVGAKIAGAGGAAIGNLAKSAGGAVADRYKDLASRVTGGGGNSNIKSVAERMNSATQATKSQTQANNSKK